MEMGEMVSGTGGVTWCTAFEFFDDAEGSCASRGIVLLPRHTPSPTVSITVCTFVFFLQFGLDKRKVLTMGMPSSLPRQRRHIVLFIKAIGFKFAVTICIDQPR